MIHSRGLVVCRFTGWRPGDREAPAVSHIDVSRPLVSSRKQGDHHVDESPEALLDLLSAKAHFQSAAQLDPPGAPVVQAEAGQQLTRLGQRSEDRGGDAGPVGPERAGSSA